MKGGVESESATRRISAVWVYLGVVLMAVLWGLVFVAVKIGGQYMPIQVFNADRFVLGVLILGVITWRSGRWQRVDWKTALELTALGLLGHGFMQMAMVSGVMLTTASISALIYGSIPLAVALISVVFKLERLRRVQWVGLWMAAAGMAAVVLLRAPGTEQGATHLGNLLVGMATLMMAAYTVWSRPLLQRLNLMFLMTWVLGVGAVVMVIWSWPHQNLALYRNLPLAGWAVILYGALFALVVPNLLYLLGVREIGRARTAAFVNAVPPIGCLAGWIGLGELLRPLQVIGAVLIIGGILLVQNRIGIGGGRRFQNQDTTGER